MMVPAVGETVPGERWTFGVDPLPQTERTAALVREVTGLVLALEHEDPAVGRLIAELERAKADLAERVPTEATPRVGDAVSSDGRVYIDHAFDIGAYNPCVPEYAIEVEGDQARGTVSFPLPYEGPPGLVHGGFLALFFDCVVQQHNCGVGVSGKTMSLALRYRRPTPLFTALTFTLMRTAAGDRIHSSGSLSVGDTVVCEAEVDAIAGVRSNLPEVSPRREGPA
jgi:hypothetical protein